MANVKRWAIRDAGIATFYALSDITGGALAGEPIVTLPSLKTSGVETTGETVYARGGRGNAKLVGFSSNREATISLEDALFDNEAMGMLTGNLADTGIKQVKRREIVTASAADVTGSVLTVSDTPIATENISAYAYVDGMKDGANLASGTASGNEIDLDSAPTENNMYVVYYTVETDSNASAITVSSDAFGGTFKLVIDLLVVDSTDKSEYAAQLVVPNAKFEDNFSLDLAADGDPAVLSLNLEILKDVNSTDMWQLIIFDEEQLS